MRIRMEFAKGEQLRFVSHLDLLKTFERAMRRADVPLAFSEGFNPHPKISFASALPVGVISAREYMDIETVVDVDTDQLVSTLNKALPEGLQMDAASTIDKGPALMALVNRSLYQVTVRLNTPISGQNLARAIEQVLQQEQIVISRTTKKGLREKDIRPGIDQLSGQVIEEKVILEMMLHAGGELNIRPEDVVSAIRDYCDVAMDIDYIDIYKKGLFIARGEELFTPLDRAVW